MRNRGWHKTLFSGLTDFRTLEKELGRIVSLEETREFVVVQTSVS